MLACLPGSRHLVELLPVRLLVSAASEGYNAAPSHIWGASHLASTSSHVIAAHFIIFLIFLHLRIEVSSTFAPLLSLRPAIASG